MKRLPALRLSRTYVRYYVLYLLVFCVPILVTTVFFMSVSRSEFRNILLLHNQHAVEKIESHVGSELVRMQAIARELSGSAELNPAFLLETPANWTAVTNRINTLAITSDRISRIVYYPFENPHGILFSADTTYTLETFFHTHAPYATWDLKGFLETARRLAAPELRTGDMLRYAYQDEAVLTWLYPIPLYSATPYGVLLMQVRQKDLDALLHLEQWSTALFDAGGQRIAGQLPFALDAFPLPKASQWVEKARVDGVEYLICGQVSERAGGLIVAAIPSSLALSQLGYLDYVWMMLLLSLLGLGLFLVYFVARRTYAPLKSLRDVMRLESLSDNEVDMAIQTIKKLRLSNETLHTRLEERLEDKQNALLAALLRGEFESLEEFNAKAASADLRLAGDTFQVALLDLKADGLPRDLLPAMAANLSGGSVVLHSLPSPLKSEWIWLITYEKADEALLWRGLEEIRDRLDSTYRAVFALCVGEAVETVSKLFVSYLQAQAARELQWIKGDNQLVRFCEFARVPSIDLTTYPRQEIENLYDAVLRLDLSGAMRVIDTLSRFVSNHQTSIFQARCLCYEMVNTTLRAMRHADMQFAVQDVLPDIAISQQIKSVADVSAIIRLLIESIQRQLPQNPSDASAKTVESIQAYIREHLEDPDFSIQRICDAFSISTSNLSHKFKGCANLTVSEYILSLRMERARELLCGTTLPIAEIALRLGYNDTSSFGKKFKERVGVSPGEFRKRATETHG